MDEKKDVEVTASAVPECGQRQSFKSKAQVFLSYYKWYILIALFFIIFITTMAIQMCTRDDYDISVMYAGNAILSDKDSAALEGAFERLGDDGEMAVLYELIIMSDAELSDAYDKGHSTSAINFEKIRKNREMFAYNIMSDEYFILMLSPECYEIMLNGGALERLTDIGAAGKPEQQYSEYALKLRELEYTKTFNAFSPLPEDTLLCFKKISEMNSEKKVKLEKREHDVRLFEKMVNYSLFNSASAFGASAKTVACLPSREELV